MFTRSRNQITEGARARMSAFAMAGVSSGGLGFLAVLHLDQMAIFDPLSAYQYWVLASSAVGGILALYLAGDRIGRSGTLGFLQGIAGGIWLTFVGALIGGTLALPLYGTMFGPFIVLVTLLGAPFIAFVWVCNLVALHLLMRRYQAERDSIFTVKQQRDVEDSVLFERSEGRSAI